MRAFLTLLIGAGLVLALARPAEAATFDIADGDVAGLISAINTANANDQHDTINLAANGLYVLVAVDTSPGSDGRTGLPPVLRDGTFENYHHLTINGNGAIIQRSTAPGTPEFRVFRVSNAFNAICTINHLTFTNGRLTGENTFGGGVSTYGHVVLNNCTVSGSTARTGGGGILNSNGRLDLNNCTVSGNRVLQGNGGGILNDFPANVSARLNLTNCTGAYQFLRGSA